MNLAPPRSLVVSRFVVICLFLSLAALTRAQTPAPFAFFPGAQYDTAIPTLQRAAGHNWAERITMHHEMERYVNALAEAAPARIRLVKSGETWEGKALYYMVIGSPENIARLDAVRAGMKKLADPRGLGANEASALIASLPAIVWLAYGVHGNEISSPDAALLTAYHMLAARGEPIADAARKNALVIIDPMQNPDGRDRFINYFRQNMGRWADADPQSAEHNEIWPTGRVNHYLFDMNRDWFNQSQPETRARTKAYLEWFPQVFVDLHEMGSNSSYYFAPPALPLNPNLTKPQLDWLTGFGKNNGKWFDKFRFDYYTRENYDSFYPGYGEGWPLFQGSVGMTYEQASVRGLIVRRTDDTAMHYRDSVHHHFIASLSTIEHTAGNREALLRYFYEYRKTAMEEAARETVKEYIITPGSDPGRAARLAALLMKSGIEVRRAEAAFSNPKTRDYFEGALQARDFPAGSYLVSLAQPAKRLAKTLLDKQTLQDREFIEEQRERNKKRRPEQFYDVTAWSLPLLWDVPCYMAEQVTSGNFTTLREEPRAAGRMRGEKASLSWLIPWGSHDAAAALADLFRQDVRVHASDVPFRLNNMDFPRGTLIVKLKDNPADLEERMRALAAAHGVDVYPTDSAWVDNGSNFGSENIKYLPRARVAMAWNTPVSQNSAGWTRYLLEQRYGCHVTTIRMDQLRGADLTRYNVIILPDGFYGAVAPDAASLRDWVSRGGVLISLAGATTWLSDERVNLLPVRREKRDKPKADKAPDKPVEADKSKTDATRPVAAADGRGGDDEAIARAIEPLDEYPSATPGAIIRVRVDNKHWLGFGYGATTTALMDSNRIFPLLKLDQGVNVAITAPADKMLVSGMMWDDAQRQLPGKAFVLNAPLGRGHIVAFTEDPNYRAFQESMSLMFLNAVLLGPGH
ncbi:MAG: M14 metallopeptidase family protein [Blastocatellia bacterium]